MSGGGDRRAGRRRRRLIADQPCARAVAVVPFRLRCTIVTSCVRALRSARRKVAAAAVAAGRVVADSYFYVFRRRQ